VHLKTYGRQTLSQKYTECSIQDSTQGRRNTGVFTMRYWENVTSRTRIDRTNRNDVIQITTWVRVMHSWFSVLAGNSWIELHISITTRWNTLGKKEFMVSFYVMLIVRLTRLSSGGTYTKRPLKLIWSCSLHFAASGNDWNSIRLHVDNCRKHELINN